MRRRGCAGACRGPRPSPGARGVSWVLRAQLTVRFIHTVKFGNLSSLCQATRALDGWGVRRKTDPPGIRFQSARTDMKAGVYDFCESRTGSLSLRKTSPHAIFYLRKTSSSPIRTPHHKCWQGFPSLRHSSRHGSHGQRLPARSGWWVRRLLGRIAQLPARRLQSVTTSASTPSRRKTSRNLPCGCGRALQ